MKRFIKAIISMEESREKFGAKLLKSFAHFRPSLSFDPVTGLPTLSLDASVKMEPDSLFGVMDLISSLHGKTKPIAVVFDEFQDILNLKDVRETLAILRARIQFHTDIPYIFAGSVRNKMDEIFIHPDSAFFKSAKLVSVGPLDSQDFIKFIESKFNSGKRSVDRQVLHTVFEICAHVAGDVQQLCSSLWEVTSSGHKINKEHIPLALKRIFAIESKVYESALLSITDQQLNCLTAVARYGGKAPTSSMFLQNSGIALASSVMKAIQRLVKLKILFRYGGEYRFSNPFFRAWLLFKNI